MEKMKEYAHILLRQRVLDWLSQNVPAPRLQHTLRVEQMAKDLAYQHHVDELKAQLAGLMHDLAKYFPSHILLEKAKEEGIEIDSVFLANPHLLHAEIGAIVARDEFGIEDEEILAAIANHTLGQPGMSPLSCVIYLADTLEPGRGHSAELETLRQLSSKDLYTAVWHTSDYTIRYLLATHRLVHPRAILTRNWALQQSEPTKIKNKD